VRVTLVTVGNPDRRTGGYRYHARLLTRLAARGVTARQVVAGPANRSGQAAAAVLPLPDDEADVLVVDALARIAGQPWIARRAGRSVVALVHELPSCADAGNADTADEDALLGCDLLIAVSPSVRDTLTARGVPPERIRIVAPGYDRHCDDVRRAQRPDEEVQVLCVAQWIPRKGIRELLLAWRASDRAGARLVVVGETDADPTYEAEVRALLTDDIEVLGSVDDATLSACYTRADLFALPSIAEGYGIVYAEALACGLPVLACTVGPVPSLVGDAGILVPPGDHGALVAALDVVLADAPLRARLAEHARNRARILPTWDDCADAFLAVLDEAVR
jgi:glycosyltransferase involved in cell wall biosynthesis